MRDLRESFVSRRVPATLFGLANLETLNALNLDTKALSTRTQLIEYPEIKGPLDKDFMEIADRPDAHGRKVRQSVVGMVVRAGIGMKGVPTMPRELGDLKKEHEIESIGPAGVFLRDSLSYGRGNDRAWLDEIWAELKHRFAEKDGQIVGRTRRETWALARDVNESLRLPRRKVQRGKAYWPGIVFDAAAADALADHDEDEVCAAPLPDGATCGEYLEGGRCPVEDTHASGPPPADGAGGAATADAAVQGELLKNGAPQTLHQGLGRQNHLLRAAGAGSQIHRRWRRLDAAGPGAKCQARPRGPPGLRP